MLVYLLLALALFQSNAFYLPGVAPRDYEEGESVDLKVNALESVKTQLPYDYYSLDFCQPGQIEVAAENLGEILSGNRIENSPYEINVTPLTNKQQFCKFLCAQQTTKRQLSSFSEKISEDYRVNWIVDNLPAATKYAYEVTKADGTKDFVLHYEKGFPLGFVGNPNDSPKSKKGVKYVNNHVRMILKYHSEKKGTDTYRVVGFEVEPFSLKHKPEGDWATTSLQLYLKDSNNPDYFPTFSNCPKTERSVSQLLGEEPQPVSHIDFGKETSVLVFWTYDIFWEASTVKWASRWDIYLKMTDSQIHWFSIINSLTIILFLSGMLAMIMMRTLHKDMLRYNEIDLSEEAAQEETGWKLIHGEVFRRPVNSEMFAVLVGTGCQVFVMTLITLTFALLGFLSPANRGGLITAMLLLYVFMGFIAGYNSTRLFKMFNITTMNWKKHSILTALFFPGLMFTVFFFLNHFVSGEKSSGAVPFSTLVALLVLWLGISVPLCYAGSWFAFKKPTFEPPVKVNEIPREPPLEQSWFTNRNTAIIIGGILPFGAVFIEIFFIMSSIWLHQFYYVFGFLFVIFLVLVIACAEISVVMCYFQLCNEDYNWWWRSYFTSGSSAMYLFLYSVLYFFTRLEIIGVVSGLLFFGYMFLVSLFFFVLTGTIGYFACFYFIVKIYSSIKID